MLVITRREGERIIVTTPSGEKIVVSLTQIDRGKARIGFDCDRSITIDREEVDAAKREGAR